MYYMWNGVNCVGKPTMHILTFFVKRWTGKMMTEGMELDDEAKKTYFVAFITLFHAFCHYFISMMEERLCVTTDINHAFWRKVVVLR